MSLSRPYFRDPERREEGPEAEAAAPEEGVQGQNQTLEEATRKEAEQIEPEGAEEEPTSEEATEEVAEGREPEAPEKEPVAEAGAPNEGVQEVEPRADKAMQGIIKKQAKDLQAQTLEKAVSGKTDVKHTALSNCTRRKEPEQRAEEAGAGSYSPAPSAVSPFMLDASWLFTQSRTCL